MEKLFVAVALLIATNVFGQLVPMLPLNDQGEIFRSEVFDFPEKSKQEIFSAAKQHLADVFLMPQFVIKHSDSIAGIIVLRASKQISNKIAAFPMHYSMKMHVKDEKVKVEVYELEFHDDHDKPYYYFKEKTFYKRNGKPKKFYQNMLNGTLTGLDELFTQTENGIKSNFNTEW